MEELNMTKIRGIEIKKSVGVAFLATLLIGIIAGVLDKLILIPYLRTTMIKVLPFRLIPITHISLVLVIRLDYRVWVSMKLQNTIPDLIWNSNS